MKRLQHQKDLNGCGIACLANLLHKPYDVIKRNFEEKFYTIERGTKIFDLVNYLNTQNLIYKSKFFNSNKKHKSSDEEADMYSKIPGSITLIAKNKKYPLGHYILRTKNGWIDPWFDFPSIDKVRAGIRKELPGDPWYVLYPIK